MSSGDPEDDLRAWMLKPPLCDLGAAIFYALQTKDRPESRFQIVKCVLAFGHLYFLWRVPWLPVPDSVVLTCKEAVAFLLTRRRALGSGRLQVRDANAMAEALHLVGFLIRTVDARSFADMMTVFIQESTNSNCKNLECPEFEEFVCALSRVYALDESEDEVSSSAR